MAGKVSVKQLMVTRKWTIPWVLVLSCGPEISGEASSKIGGTDGDLQVTVGSADESVANEKDPEQEGHSDDYFPRQVWAW